MRPVYTPAVPEGPSPQFQRLADAVAADIRLGALRPGERLPGTRALAERLSWSRNTVARAYDELEAQGWIQNRPASGATVAPSETAAPPQPRPMRFRLPPGPPPEPEPPPGALILQGGMPDLRQLPVDPLARALRRALARRGADLLGYGDPAGLLSAREAVARWLGETRGLALQADDLLLTRGAQQALYLAAGALIRPGQRVGVERYGYRPAWAALREAGAVLVPLPVDSDGLVVEALADAGPLAGVYVTPHHQFPTGASLTAPRRQALLAWAADHGAFVLEDDFDHEFHYEGQPLRPLASADPDGVVLYVGTLSKAFAPGVRLGWLCAPGVARSGVAERRRLLDRQGDPVMEAAIAELITEGELGRHIRRMTRIYRRRRDLLVHALTDLVGEALQITPPRGGLALWAHARGLDVERWRRRAWDQGVVFGVAREYDLLDEPASTVRLGFARCNEPELLEAARRLARALPEPGAPGRVKASR